MVSKVDTTTVTLELPNDILEALMSEETHALMATHVGGQRIFKTVQDRIIHALEMSPDVKEPPRPPTCDEDGFPIFRKAADG